MGPHVADPSCAVRTLSSYSRRNRRWALSMMGTHVAVAQVGVKGVGIDVQQMVRAVAYQVTHCSRVGAACRNRRGYGTAAARTACCRGWRRSAWTLAAVAGGCQEGDDPDNGQSKGNAIRVGSHCDLQRSSGVGTIARDPYQPAAVETIRTQRPTRYQSLFGSAPRVEIIPKDNVTTYDKVAAILRTAQRR